VALWDKGIMDLPLTRLNARLAPHGYAIRATKGRNSQRLVACINEDGRVERYGLFELRPVSPKRSRYTDTGQSRGRERRHADDAG
jgi:hypothetical protein